MGEKERPNRAGSRGREGVPLRKRQDTHVAGVTISHTFPPDPRDATSGLPPTCKTKHVCRVLRMSRIYRSNYVIVVRILTSMHMKN